MARKFKYYFPLGLLVIFFWQIPFARYAYLDEAHQLWHNEDGSNFVMFATQGRFITGWIFNKFFYWTKSIDDLKYLRLFSFAGWCLAAVLWPYLLNKWNRFLQLPDLVITFSSIFLVCSLPVAIYIGWASCLEVFIGFAAGLFSGHLLFMNLMQPKESIRIPVMKLLVIVFSGLMSLFIYQNCFGCFLIPFAYYFFFVSRKIEKKLIIGVAFYLLIVGVYFFLFKYSLTWFHLTGSDRTGLQFDILGKLSFFVSHPLALAFSFNFLYNYHGILSQAFYPLCALLLIISIYRINKKVKETFGILVVLLIICLLMYIPGLVVSENFASYRTMLALSLLIPVVLFGNIFILTERFKYQRQIALAFIGIIIIAGYYNFNLQFIDPLKYEYAKLRDRLNQESWQKVDTVYFVRASENAFSQSHGVKDYKDEFGLPSTFKDWTPDPFIRQVCFENTKDRKNATSLIVIHRASDDSLNWGNTGKHPVIYMDTLINPLNK